MKKGKKIIKENPRFGMVSLSAPDAVWNPDVYQKGKRALEERGIEIVENETVHTKYFYLANEPQVIADNLHKMFMRKDLDAIMCAGGGINMNKILPFIDFGLLRKNPKPFIGISNIVVLMVAMLKRNIVSFHGPSIWNYGLPNTPTEYTHNNLIQALGGYIGKLPAVTDWKVFNSGEAEGELMGGNIASLATVVGSRYCPVELFRDKILILEDIGEDFGELDSMLTLMDLLGVFQKIKGVIIGKLKDCSAPQNVEMDVRDFIKLVFSKYDFPIIYDCDFGHVPDNLCLPFGCRARMIAKEKPELILLEAGVEE